MKREGYLLIDHSASPGLTEQEAVAFNWKPSEVGAGRRLEQAIIVCVHCRKMTIKNPLRVRERATCAKCGHGYLCDGCWLESRLPDYDHLPFEKKADVMQEYALRGFILDTPQALAAAAKIRL